MKSWGPTGFRLNSSSNPWLVVQHSTSLLTLSFAVLILMLSCAVFHGFFNTSSVFPCIPAYVIHDVASYHNSISPQSNSRFSSSEPSSTTVSPSMLAFSSRATLRKSDSTTPQSRGSVTLGALFSTTTFMRRTSFPRKRSVFCKLFQKHIMSFTKQEVGSNW